MNYIKRFQDTQALSVLVRNRYTEDKMMHILLDDFRQGGKYTAQIAIQQAYLRREVTFTDQNLYLFHLYRLIN